MAAAAAVLAAHPQGGALAPQSPSASGRHTVARGGVVFGGAQAGRFRHATHKTIAKINAFRQGVFCLTVADRHRLRGQVAFAIQHYLDVEKSFCCQDGSKVRAAVEFLEVREPRLASPTMSWGACAFTVARSR